MPTPDPTSTTTTEEEGCNLSVKGGSTSNLLPCPFCGAAATHGDPRAYDRTMLPWVECPNPTCEINMTHNTPEQVVAAWNRRHGSTEVGRLRQAMWAALGCLDDPTGGEHVADMRKGATILRDALALVPAPTIGWASEPARATPTSDPLDIYQRLDRIEARQLLLYEAQAKKLTREQLGFLSEQWNAPEVRQPTKRS